MQSVINSISTRQAEATANEWLICYVGDRFLAGTPQLDAAVEVWHIPLLYLYPGQGALGEVGEMTVDAISGAIKNCPTIEQIKQQAMLLYQAHATRE